MRWSFISRRGFRCAKGSPVGTKWKVCYLPDTFAGGADLLGICAKYRLEGIVSQRLDRPYVSGPTRDWIKVKCAGWKEANRWRAEVFEKAR